MAVHLGVVGMVQGRDERGPVGEVHDQHGVPVSLADEVALGVAVEQAAPADLGSGGPEGIDVTLVGGDAGLVIGVLGLIWPVGGLDPELQQVDLRNGPIVGVIAEGAELVGGRLHCGHGTSLSVQGSRTGRVIRAPSVKRTTLAAAHGPDLLRQHHDRYDQATTATATEPQPVGAIRGRWRWSV